MLGIDANAAAMTEAARRAAGPAKRGGLRNALFVVAAAEALPEALASFADSLTIHFPWGSLLRGLLAAEPRVTEGIARVTKPGANIEALVSVIERDQAGLAPFLPEAVTSHVRLYQRHGLELCDVRPATKEQIAASRSSWAKRLGAGERRPAWWLRFERRA